MGKIYIKKEGGKEVAYEKSGGLGLSGDIRIGELHSNSWEVYKETRNTSGKNVRVYPEEGILSAGERRAEVVDTPEALGTFFGLKETRQSGTFSRDTYLFTDEHPSFHADPKRETSSGQGSGSRSPGESHITSSYDYGSGGGGYIISGRGSPVRQDTSDKEWENRKAFLGILMGLGSLIYLTYMTIVSVISQNNNHRQYESAQARTVVERTAPPTVYPAMPSVTFRTPPSSLPEARQPEQEYQPSYTLPSSPPETYTPPRTYAQPYSPAPAPEPYNPLAKTPENVQIYIPPIGQQMQVREPVYVVDTVFENPTDAYRSLLPSSPVAQSAPPGYAPVVRETRNFVSGRTMQQVEYMPVTTMRADTIHELTMTYPRSGRRYTIERARYPEFYRRLDLDGDGAITLNEVGTWQYVFTEITRRHREGDMDAVVRDFMRNVLIVR